MRGSAFTLVLHAGFCGALPLEGSSATYSVATLMLSAQDIEAIRSIARVSGDYDTIKRLIGETTVGD